MPSFVLMILKLPFLRKRWMQPFVHFSIVFCLYIVLHNWESRSSNFFVFQILKGILMKPAAFRLLIFFNTASSSSSVNCPSLISRWLSSILFYKVCQWLLEGFPSRCLKYSFHFWSISFSFALKVLFLLLTSFTHQRNCYYYNDSLQKHTRNGLLIWLQKNFFDIVAGVLQGDTLVPIYIYYLPRLELQISIDLIKENSFTLKETSRQEYPAETMQMI